MSGLTFSTWVAGKAWPLKELQGRPEPYRGGMAGLGLTGVEREDLVGPCRGGTVLIVGAVAAG